MVEYNKINKPHPIRSLRSAEIDHQYSGATKVSVSELDGLREEINMLRNNISNTSIMATDDISTKLDEALEEISAELEQRYIDRISLLETTLDNRNTYIIKLEDRVEKQDILIQKLTNSMGTVQVLSNTVPNTSDDRPGMDSVFIDPTAKGAEDKFESYVKTKEVKSSKSTTSSSINKLKDLMGSKLPK